jgi:hypothetical protein
MGSLKKCISVLAGTLLLAESIEKPFNVPATPALSGHYLQQYSVT